MVSEETKPIVSEETKPVTKKKLVPFNPFEVSDDEEPQEEVTSRKKIVPEQGLSTQKPRTKPPSRHNVITLPDTSGKKITPKKKLAPLPPTQAPSPATPVTPVAPVIHSKNEDDSSKLLSKPTKLDNECTPDDKLLEGEDSKFDDLEGEHNASTIDVQKHRHRPAPPRPMPAKRRVCRPTVSRFLFDCASCLGSKAATVESKTSAEKAPQWKY